MHKKGVAIAGVCGGYQLLGEEIHDPYHTESDSDMIYGLGLLGMKTVFEAEKLTSQVIASCRDLSFLGQLISADGLRGYEIHMGKTEFTRPDDRHPFVINERRNEPCQETEGTASADGLVFGTYIHGIFDNDSLRRSLLNALRVRKGLQPISSMRNVLAEKQQAYERLADIVEQHLDMDKIKHIMEDMA